MTYIVNYIIALTFGILGWQVQTPEFQESIETITYLSDCTDSRKEIEKSKIDPDTFLLFKDFQVDLKVILTTKHPN